MSAFIGPLHPCYFEDTGEYEHEFEVQDESFDHAFGTEIVVYNQCINCGLCTEYEPPDYCDDYY